MVNLKILMTVFLKAIVLLTFLFLIYANSLGKLNLSGKLFLFAHDLRHLDNF